MINSPVRVAIISPHQVIRAGLTSVVAQLAERAMVTDAVVVDRGLLDHDVAIYDVDGVADPSAYDDLQTPIDSDTQVIALVYDRHRNTLPPVLGETNHTITLSVTAAELGRVLDEVTADGAITAGNLTDGQLPDDLTRRELDVLRLMAAGRSNHEIAALLFLSINSIKTYIRSAYNKIGAKNRSGALRWALRHGLFPQAPAETRTLRR